MSLDPIKLLRDMIAIPSVNPMRAEPGMAVEKDLVDYLENALRREGIDCERQLVADGRENLVAIVDASFDRTVSDGLMFNSHLDTVPVANMSIDPFDPVERDGRIFGRGACDAKGSIAAMMTALVEHSRKTNRSRPVVFAAMVDEEFSFSGSWKLIEKNWPVSACVVGEPTKLSSIIAHKGIARWRAKVKGISAHGAMPKLGRNAIYDGARFVMALEKYAGQLVNRAPHSLLGVPTLNVGRVAGGSSVNIVIKVFLLTCAFVCVSAAQAQTPPSPVFFKTQNSDEWVRKSIRIQSKYRRVLLVDNSGSRDQIRTVRVTPLELNNRNPSPHRISIQYPVAASFTTLQDAADAARGGDLVAVMPGTYAGFVLGEKPDAADDRYIHFKALGRPGECSINRSFNLAGLQESLIQNNLLYGNFNHGIAQWDDANPYDESYVEPGPQSSAAVKSANDLPLWGCHSNVIRNNTVLMNNKGRAAMQARNGSWGTVLRNNIFINDQASSIEIFNTSIFRLDARFNVVNTISYSDMAESLKTLAISLPEGVESRTNVTRETIAGDFVRYGEEPWVIIEGNWWRLNPNRPNFQLRANSKMLSHGGDKASLPARDLMGNIRRGPSVGALEPAQK